MKKILITGSNSYVGTSLEKWLRNYPGSYSVESISLRDDSWKEKDFSKYEVVVHVAGIAHIKETKKNAPLYYRVNRDLSYEVAQKAKAENVSQFIFLSSMSVYGIDSGIIDGNSIPKPKSNYGRSKLQAEELISTLEDSIFKVSILRPPMIYGENCKGNYNRLAKLASITPIFPDIRNERSMIFIDNLSEFIRILIDNNAAGLYFPQNKNYINTTNLVKLITKAHNKEIKTTKFFNWLIVLGLEISGTLRKVFGTLIYDKKISLESMYLNNIKENNYETSSFKESILKTEKNRGD